MFHLNRNSCRRCFLMSKYFIRNLHLVHRKRYIKQKATSNVPSSIAQLQVIGSGAPDQPASVMLKTTNKKYLFNCGEGIQSLSQNANTSLMNIHHMFFTQSKWNCIGGITNVMFATIASSGYLPTIYGPKNLKEIFARMSRLSIVYSFFKHRFETETFKTNERFEDHNLIIEPIELKYFKDSAFIYVCKLKACEGKFSIGKSVEKNVPGKLVINLHRGEKVTLDDGTVVTPNDVKNPDCPEMYFIVIDVPVNGFLNDLETNLKLRNLLKDVNSTGVEAIIHFTPKKVFQTQRYQSFIEYINPKRNMIVNDMNKHSCMKDVYALQKKLHKINSKIHPLLSTQLETDPRIFDPCDMSSEQYGNSPTFYSKYILRDVPKVDKHDAEYSDEEVEFFRINNHHSNEHEINFQMNSENVPLKLKNEQFPRILFLGTGASDSFALRSSSAILLHLSENDAFLLDCGSGACSQINRFYGKEAPEIYRRLKAVYVSHMHLDHHIGIPEIFRYRQRYLPKEREPLRIFCPFIDFQSWILFYANNIERIHSDMKLIDNDSLFNIGLPFHERLYLNIDSINTCPVEHYKKSYAMTLKFTYRNRDKTGKFKLAYSGDTGLSEHFVKLGYKADLLIHEATFQDSLQDVAWKYRHSTTAMAIEQSKRMQAKHTILTHFSSRYHTVPYINEELDRNTGIAFDNMEVTPEDLPGIGSLFPQYQNAFPKETKELEQKSKNYLYQRGFEAHVGFE